MSLTKIFVAFCIGLTSLVASATDILYSAKSQDQGMKFELTVTEVKREPSKSTLTIPGFHKRTAEASRWLMCVYTDLAYQRGFKYWTAVYPDEPSEIIVVGLYQSEDADIPGTLGSDYVAARAMPPKPASVQVIQSRLCGKKQN
jgi:hypothetical protein